MKLSTIFISLTAVILMAGCAKVDVPEYSAECGLNSLKAYVYTEDLSKKTEVNLLSGKYMSDKGYISYTFKAADGFSAEGLTRCRIEAGIPSTATLEVTDEFGIGSGHGFENFYDLSDAGLYFKVVAASGESKNFQLFCTVK